MHRGHGEIHLFGSKGVARRTVNSEKSDDVAALRLHDIFHLIRVHPHESADAHILPGAPVDDRIAPLDRALVDPNISQLTKSCFFELERERDEGVLRIRRQNDLCFILQDVQGFVADVSGIGQVKSYCVQERLNGRVLVG